MTKLYHGTDKNFMPGDMLETDKSNCVGINVPWPAVYATSHFKLAIQYTLHPVNRMWNASDVMYLPALNLMVLKNEYTNEYVYRVDNTDFQLLGTYADGTGDEWVSPNNVKIEQAIQLNADALVKNGYDVRVMKGNKLSRALLFRLAKLNLVTNMSYDDKQKFNKFMDLISYKKGADENV